MSRTTRAALSIAALATGCGGRTDQSMLHPAGPAAADIARLSWIMLVAFTGVFLIVVALLSVALFKKSHGSDSAPPFGRTGFIIAGGVALPFAILTPLYLFSLQTSRWLRSAPEALTIRVVGHRWWWEVYYPERGVVTANEIHIPVGKRVRLELTSADVIHSFWVPRLHGKRDMIPGVVNVFSIEADEPGVFRGQCGEYCGTQHAKMAFHVVALPQEEFDRWLAERTKPRAMPTKVEERRGFQVFMKTGCAQCHALRGTAAVGNTGPDLTHLGARSTLGAALMPNTPVNLARWIADPQALKPGARMPRTELAPHDQTALVSFLESLQ
jgi:cytochrome c oxidase subunit II